MRIGAWMLPLSLHMPHTDGESILVFEVVRLNKQGQPRIVFEDT